MEIHAFLHQMRTDFKVMLPDDQGIKKYNRQVDLISISLSDSNLFCITRFFHLIQTFLYCKGFNEIK